MMFSVVIPLYNKAPYVAKAIGSVLSQTFSDYELIIVDDGSRDASAEMAETSIAGHPQCRLIRQENAGVSVARNNGVAASNGDYLCFLDADDWWAPSFLEEMAGFIGEYPDAGIYGTGYTIVNERKHRTRVAPVGVEDGFEKGYINYCQVYAKTLAMPLWTGAVCLPRTVFNQAGGFPQGVKLGEDFLLWIRIALHSKVALLNKPLSYYNQDVDVADRGVGRLYKPEEHMLWHLGPWAEEENSNADFKRLIDGLRTYGLRPYYLQRQYRTLAREELEKVDWSKQSESVRFFYRGPVWCMVIQDGFLKWGSRFKTMIIRLFH